MGSGPLLSRESENACQCACPKQLMLVHSWDEGLLGPKHFISVVLSVPFSSNMSYPFYRGGNHSSEKLDCLPSSTVDEPGLSPRCLLQSLCS